MTMRAGLAKVAEYRKGRNFIRVRAIFVDERTSEVAHVEVFGGRAGRAMVRSFCPERIERVAQTRNGKRREEIR